MATPAALRMATSAAVGISSLPVRRTTISTTTKSSSSHCMRRVVAPGKSQATQSRVASNSSLLLRPSSFGFLSSTITENRLRATRGDVLGGSTRGGALGAVCQLPTTPENLRCVIVVASAALTYLKSSGIQGQYIVPLLAVEAPRKAIGWILGDYGLWVAFVALAVKLFGYLPVVLELPLYIILLIITAPTQVTQYRGTQISASVSLALAAYLGYQHFQSGDGVKGAFKGEAIFPSIAIIFLTIIPILFLINGTSA